MRIDKRSRSQEKLILTGMIVDRAVLGRIAVKWDGQLFRTKWANLIGGWCVKYFNKYEKAPMSKIEHIYETWADKHTDEESVKLVERFLDALSEEYVEAKQESNSNYILDVAGVYFNQVRLEKLSESIQSEIDLGRVEDANNQVVQFHQIELGRGEGINVLQDKEAIKEAFEDKSEPLITYPGDLGKFFRDALERDSFVSFLGPEKRGKTWWLIEMAYQAMLQRRKVAFFAVGDMTQNQMMRRLMVRTSGIPLFPKKYRYPTSITHIKGKKFASAARKIKVSRTPLNWGKAMKQCEVVMRTKIRSKRPLFKLSCHPNSTLNVRGLKSILQGWEREEEWVPDVIVIDYADILNMSYPGIEGRERINETWKQLRSLSQEYHCLVITATQSDAASNKAETLNESHFSDDKRKAAHVTGMIGLNQTEREKKKGIMRLNWIYLRESRFIRSKCVHVAGCLDVGRPVIKSSF